MKYDATELKKNEVWIGNTSNIKDFPRQELKSLKAIRLGQQAYDIHGEKLDIDYCLPIFIDKSELDLYDKTAK